MSLALTDPELSRLLRDDVPHGDLTTTALGLGAQGACLHFLARQEMTLSATEEAARLLVLVGAQVDMALPSGSRVGAHTLFLKAMGQASDLHRAWKVAQTLVEYASGLASAASAIVQAVRAAGLNTPVACTRKHFPGTKAIAVKSVLAGGAVMHRLGLSETLLVFPEHRVFVPESELVMRLAQAKARNPEKKLVVEVCTVNEAVHMAHAGAEVIQLEKFSPSQVAECRAALAGLGLQVCLAPAGGVTAANAVAYAQAGADVLVTSAPYFAPPADVKVVLQPAVAAEAS